MSHSREQRVTLRRLTGVSQDVIRHASELAKKAEDISANTKQGLHVVKLHHQVVFDLHEAQVRREQLLDQAHLLELSVEDIELAAAGEVVVF